MGIYYFELYCTYIQSFFFYISQAKQLLFFLDLDQSFLVQNSNILYIFKIDLFYNVNISSSQHSSYMTIPYIKYLSKSFMNSFSFLYMFWCILITQKMFYFILLLLFFFYWFYAKVGIVWQQIFLSFKLFKICIGILSLCFTII